MAWEIPDESLPDENGVYTKSVYISTEEINVSANGIGYQNYYFTPPVIPKNAKIQEVYIQGAVQIMGGGNLSALQAISVNDTYVERDFTQDNYVRANLRKEIQTGTLSIEWHASESTAISRMRLNTYVYVKYTLIPVQDSFITSKIHTNGNSLSNLCLGGTTIKKAYLGNNLIHQVIPEEDIIASYRAIKPKKILLATLDEYNAADGYVEKNIPGLVLYSDHVYNFTFESDGYEYGLPTPIVSDNGNEIYYDYYEGSMWLGSDELRLTYKTSTGSTYVFCNFSYTGASANIYLLDYSEATINDSYVLHITGAVENCSVMNKDEVLYLCRNSQNYSPTTINGSTLTNNLKNTLKNVYKISDSITDMQDAFSNCVNLENAICGVNVTNMDRAFYNCRKLGSTVYCEENVTSMVETFSYSFTRYNANIYLMSPNITNMYKCIYNKLSSTYTNIYVPKNSTTLNSCLATDSSKSLTGTSLTFTYNSSSGYYESDSHKIRIYPIDDVRATYNNRVGN